MSYPTQPAASNSNAAGSPFLPTFDELQGELLRRRYDDMDDHHYHRIQYQAIDLRLLTLLEFSRELYSRRSELFEKFFRGLRDDSLELLKRIDGMVLKGKLNNFHQTQVRNRQRSLSVGSPRTPSSSNRGEQEEDFRLKRFKLRTVVAGGGDHGGGSGGDGDARNGSGGAN